MKRAPLSHDATQRDHVRRILDVLTVAAVVSGAFVAVEAVISENWRSWAIALVLAGFAVLLVARPRRIWPRVASRVRRCYSRISPPPTEP